MRKLAFLLAWLFLVAPCGAETIIVDPNGSADFNNIQDAINYSWHGDTIIVRPGTYNENIYFNGRAIRLTSENPNDSNIVDSTIISNNLGNSVTFDFGEDGNSVITGFTIIANNGNGIYCYASSPTITKNVIKDCGSYGIGGGQAAPTISENVINSNIVGIDNCNGLITGNIISDNRDQGIKYCDGNINNNIVSGNKKQGLIHCDGTISNNSIMGNSSSGIEDCGGAIVKNNIIAFNYLGINGSCVNSYNAFWMNRSSNLCCGATVGEGDIVVNPLFATDGYWSDPCGTPENPSDDVWTEGDYHLKSAAGRWDPNSETWVVDDVNSPCIDAGDPCDSIGYEPNPNGGRINMGAYGGTTEASKSPSGIVEPICTEYPAMDFNKDCKVDFEDFAIFTQSWLECNLDQPGACWE